VSLRPLVEQVLKGLGKEPSRAEFQEEAAGEELTLTVRLPYADLQALDGRDHRRARALRQLVSAAAAAQGKKLHLVAQAND